MKAANACNIPVVLHIHDIYPESLIEKLPKCIGRLIHSLILPLDRSILKSANTIICISPNMIAYLKESRSLYKSRFELIRNWQNDDHFSYEHPLANNESLTFMYLGSISPSAGIETLIRAFDYAKIDNSKLIIAGDGADKENCIKLAEEIQNIGISFCGANPNDVAMLQAQADILLLPLKKGLSLTATPSKLTAYMLSGKPIIACVEPESDTARIINTSESGFISLPEDYMHLSNIMKNCYNR